MFVYPKVNDLEFCSIMDRFVPGNLIVSAQDPHIRANQWSIPRHRITINLVLYHKNFLIYLMMKWGSQW
jgi:hypothetical protein